MVYDTVFNYNLMIFKIHFSQSKMSSSRKMNNRGGRLGRQADGGCGHRRARGRGQGQQDYQPYNNQPSWDNYYGVMEELNDAYTQVTTFQTQSQDAMEEIN